MHWLFFTLLSVLFVSLAVLLQRVLMRDGKSNPYTTAIVFQLLVAILNLPIVLLHGFQLPPFDLNVLFIVMSAFLWGGGSVFFFKALKLIEASEVTIVSSARIIITIFASIIFLHEPFSALNALGTILVLISILLVTDLRKGLRFNKGVLYALATALFSGLAIVADGFNVKNYDVISYSAILNFLIFIILLVFYPRTLQQWKDVIQPNFLKKMLPIGIFATVQGVSFLIALDNGGNASQVGTIRQASVIITVILAVIFLNEKDHLGRKLFAAILVTVGVVLLK